MKQHQWPDKVNISDTARATRKNRATVARAAQELPYEEGEDGGKYYDPHLLFQALYVGVGGPSYSEAHRLLTIKRTEQVELQNQLTRKERIPIEDVSATANEVFMAIAGTIKANQGKVLTESLINDMFSTLRNWATRELIGG